MRFLLAVMVMAFGACATQSSERAGDDDGDAACTPWTCAQAGAACGTIPDGCDGMLECGTCTEEDTACVPRTCETENATCGQRDDGCGGMLECGTCEDGGACVTGACVQLACGNHEKNACGGCDAMPLEPGDLCPCGEAAVCDPNLKFIVCQNDGEPQQPDTTDAYDPWTLVSQHLEGYAGYYGPEVHAQYEYIRVNVDDTFWGLMQPEMTFRYSGDVPVTVCMSASDGDGSLAVLARCSDTGGPWNGNGCCKEVAAGQTTVNIGLQINLGIPNPGDDDLSVRMTVSPSALMAHPYCSAYSIQYRF
jgi:hypothetical protein